MSSYDERESSRQPISAFFWPVLFLLLLIGVLVWKLWPHGEAAANLNATPRPVAARGPLDPDEIETIKLYKKVSPSVVHVTNVALVRESFSFNVQQEAQGTGSGFVWSDEGLIVTNYHVVKDADAVQVVLADKDRSTYETRSWVSYPDKDMAVVWIKNVPKSKLPPIEIGTSHDLQVGQKAFAIGNPFGLDQTLTTGIISALGREIQSATNHPIRGVIQTNTAINPGNSGGPLLDSAGRLIGMNTAILSPSGAFAGVGFAIPVDEIYSAVPKLIAELKKHEGKGHMEVSPPRLGIQIAEKQLAEELGVTEGVLIIRVLPDSPAARAGLHSSRRGPSGKIQLGDVIVAFDGDKVQSVNDLYAHLEKHQIGDTVTLTVLRDGERQDVKVTLQAME